MNSKCTTYYFIITSQTSMSPHPLKYTHSSHSQPSFLTVLAKPPNTADGIALVLTLLT